MRRGRLDHWNDAKGYGFIKPDLKGADRVFVHISVFDGPEWPQQGDIVEYVTEFDAKARMRASRAKVVFASARIQGSSTEAKATRERCQREEPQEPSNPRPFLGALFAASFLIFLCMSVLVGYTQPALALLYFAASLVTFVVYAFDKHAAKSNMWRTKESSLHTLELFGGWPGALFAQRFLHHKSRKTSYQVMFWIITILNIAAFAYSFTRDGAMISGKIFGEISEDLMQWLGVLGRR